jgi:hypothetical protein
MLPRGGKTAMDGPPAARSTGDVDVEHDNEGCLPFVEALSDGVVSSTPQCQLTDLHALREGPLRRQPRSIGMDWWR